MKVIEYSVAVIEDMMIRRVSDLLMRRSRGRSISCSRKNSPHRAIRTASGTATFLSETREREMKG